MDPAEPGPTVAEVDALLRTRPVVWRRAVRIVGTFALGVIAAPIPWVANFYLSAALMPESLRDSPVWLKGWFWGAQAIQVIPVLIAAVYARPARAFFLGVASVWVAMSVGFWH